MLFPWKAMALALVIKIFILYSLVRSGKSLEDCGRSSEPVHH
jgi:hypothetical protein